MKLFKHTTTIPEDKPAETHIHNDAPSYAGAIIAGLLGIALLGWLLWRAIVGLFASAGYWQPERAAAHAIGWVVVVLFVWFLLSVTLSPIFGKWLAHREAMAVRQIELAREMARMQTSRTTDARVIDPRIARRNRLIEVLLVEMYHHGQYAPGERRPWARRNAAAVKLTNDDKPVGETLANSAKQWLVDNGVIYGKNGAETINFRRYPDIASVQRKLYAEQMLVIRQ